MLIQNFCVVCLLLTVTYFFLNNKLYKNIYLSNKTRSLTAPSVFSALLAILRPFMNEKTFNKFRIFNHDFNKWKSEIVKEVNPEQLPQQYGGTMVDPDGNPNCITKV